MNLRRPFIVVMAIAFCLAAGAAQGFDPNHVARLLATKQCRSCDLDGATLAGINLQGANLEVANLQGADLTNTNLSYASLRAANLSIARMRGANLTGADVHNADFDGADLYGATWTDGSKCAARTLGRCH